METNLGPRRLLGGHADAAGEIAEDIGAGHANLGAGALLEQEHHGNRDQYEVVLVRDRVERLLEGVGTRASGEEHPTAEVERSGTPAKT